MKKSTQNMLILGIAAAVGYYLYNKSKQASLPLSPAPAPSLPAPASSPSAFVQTRNAVEASAENAVANALKNIF